LKCLFKIKDGSKIFKVSLCLQELILRRLFEQASGIEDIITTVDTCIRNGDIKLTKNTSGYQLNLCKPKSSIVSAIDLKEESLDEIVFSLFYNVETHRNEINGLKTQVAKLIDSTYTPRNNKMLHVVRSDSHILRTSEYETLAYWLGKSFKLELLFSTYDDGDRAWKFHSNCDNMGATVTFIESEMGRRFGGFTSV
jgi:hypothetical protein